VGLPARGGPRAELSPPSIRRARVFWALYLYRRTDVLGALLLTAYLGGACAAQVRIDAPLYSTLLFPVCTGIAVWGGLWLRDAEVRALVPLRRR